MEVSNLLKPCETSILLVITDLFYFLTIQIFTLINQNFINSENNRFELFKKIN